MSSMWNMELKEWANIAPDKEMFKSREGLCPKWDIFKG